MVLLDRFVPTYDIRERHTLDVAAPAERVLAATRDLTARELPLFLVLMGLRGLPVLLRGRLPFRPDRPILEDFLRLGFVTLAETPDEVVLGGIGRFWRPTGGLRRVSAEEFADFDEPGWAKAIVNFHAERRDDHTLLSTETRVAATDESSRRNFRRYWRVIWPGSVAIRIVWLRAIRRRAQR
jgi:hypothetical protein